MTTTVYQSFESGQSSGTTITAGNSGTGGTAFDSTTVPAGSTLTFDGTALRGTLSMLATTGGTPTTASGTWTTALAATLAHVYGRCTVKPGTLAVTMAPLRCRHVTVQTFRITLNTAGKFELRDTVNTVLVTAATGMTTSDTWRIAWDITMGVSNTGILYIFHDPTSDTPDETLTANAASFGATSTDEANVGLAVNVANGSIRIDDFLLTDVALPKAPFHSVTLADTLTLADAMARATAIARAQGESLTLADTMTRLTALARAQGESLSLADAFIRATALARAQAESLTLADQVARLVAQGRALTDTLSLADAYARSTAAPRALTDTLTLADAMVMGGIVAPPTQQPVIDITSAAAGIVIGDATAHVEVTSTQALIGVS